MSFGFNPETFSALFLGAIAWAQLRKNCCGSSCKQDSCCGDASPVVAPAIVSAPVAPVAPAPVAAPVVAAPAPVVVAPAPVAAPAPAVALAPEGEDPTLLAVLAAAVATTLGPNARIVGVSPVASPIQNISALTAWSMEGRREIYLSHRIR
jgi:hypothetical protein